MTAMIDIDDFLPEALRYAPNTSDVVAQRFIVQAARDICDRCKLWRVTDEIEVTAPEFHGLVTVSDAHIVSIENARMGTVNLEPVTTAWLDEYYPDWNFPEDTTGPARFVTQIQPNTITLVPRTPGTLNCRLVLKPSRNAQTLPEFLLDNYAEEIGRGAAGRILTDPTSQNPQLGLDHRQWFEARLEKIAVSAIKGQQGAKLRIKGAYF